MRAHRVLCIGLGLGLGLGLAVARAAPRDPVAEGASLRERGRYAEARKVLEAAVQQKATPEARYQLGLTYHAIGARPLERAVWNSYYDDYERGRVDKKSARALTYVARAAQLLGGWKDANETYREAVDADEHGQDGARANIAWARLFLDKYDAGHAEACLDDALKILPEDPGARALLAAVKLEQSYDVPGALRELDRAEKASPGFPEALAIRGKVALETEQPALAKKYAAQLLARNPEDLAARVILGGAAMLADDATAYDAERQRVLAVNPLESRFFHEVAELLTRNHRYADAIPLEEEAIKVDPKDAVARAAYGANLLRLGRETEGLAALREAWRGDKYNVRTYNLLQLFEDVIPKRYVTFEAPPFRFRVPVKERALLEATIVPFMMRAKKTLDRLYGFSPKTPITIELYTDPKHYAVRTVGLPGLDAIVAVTFGQVVTSMSPSVGKFDWGMVLWHELAHVYAIEASRSRVPRWFTEGLSEYETTIADPRWTRRTSAELAGALARDELLPVGALDQAFVAARDVPHMALAYHESSAAVSYFVERAGRKGVGEALLAFGAGRGIAEIIQSTTGQPLAEFDAGFRAWLRKRLAVYDGQLIVRAADAANVEELDERVKQAPTDGRARGLLVLGHLAHGELDQARAQLGEAKPDDAPELRYARVRVRMAEHKYEEAKIALDALRAIAHGADVEILTAQLHKIQNDVEGAWGALSAAAAADPDRADPQMMLAALASGSPRPLACGTDAAACEIAALQRAFELDIIDPTIGKRLVKLLAPAHRKDAIVAAGRTLEITPFDGALRLELAALLADEGDVAGAGRELARARLCPLSDELMQRAAKLDARLQRPR